MDAKNNSDGMGSSNTSSERRNTSNPNNSSAIAGHQIVSSRDAAEIESVWSAVQFLRENGPWERQQDHNSLIPYAIEELWELLEAIEHRNSTEIQQELGDVLLQVLFHSAIAHRNDDFTLADVAATLNAKLKERSAPVFAGNEVTVAEQEHYWQSVKQSRKESEKSKKIPSSQEIFSGIPTAMPVVLRVHKVINRVRDYDFPEKLLPPQLRYLDIANIDESELHFQLEKFINQCTRICDVYGIIHSAAEWEQHWAEGNLG